MLRRIFGSSDKVKKPSSNDIKAFAQTHNALLQAGKIKLVR